MLSNIIKLRRFPEKQREKILEDPSLIEYKKMYKTWCLELERIVYKYDYEVSSFMMKYRQQTGNPN